MRPRGPAYSLRFGLIALVVLAAIGGGAYFVLNNVNPPSPPEVDLPVVPILTPPSAAALIETMTPTPKITPRPTATPSPTPAVPPGGIVYAISPDINSIGWVQSDEPGNHFGESFLYAGQFGDVLYYGAMQFDLSFIPDGATIFMAELELSGLVDGGLSENSAFVLNILGLETDIDWSRHNFEVISNAPVEEPLTPILVAADLGQAQKNTFIFNAAQRSIIEERLKFDFLSFRLDSLNPDQEGRFGWDSGYGEESQGRGPTLRLGVLPPLPTPVPEDALIADETGTPDPDESLFGTPRPTATFVVITSTPTPESVFTVAAIAPTLTSEATTTGTPTPLPPNWVTPWAVTSTPTPENIATTQYQQAVATSIAIAYGTPTPTPANMVTATPTPTSTPPPTKVVITSTPTPESVFTAAAVAATATYEATTSGTSTPLPPNWATPLVVTSTPTPENSATAQYQQALATANVIAHGTSTPTPANMVTATPTPIFIVLIGELPLMTPTPTATAAPGSIPRELIGMIAFKSDRTGREEIYVINPDGSGLALLTSRWPYDVAREADAYSADGRFQVFTKEAIRYKEVEITLPTGEKGTTFARDDAASLYWYDALYNVEKQLTFFGAGIAYDGVWSPTAEQIAFVATENGNDEIWIVNRDGSGLRQLTRNEWEWDKQPSWSPDGQQIVFWSNRTGNGQIWVMDTDGHNMYSLSRTGFNDWDPVWIKHPNIPKFTG